MPEKEIEKNQIRHTEKKSGSDQRENMKPTKQNTMPEKQSGPERTKQDLEQAGTPGTKELSTQSGDNSSKAVSVIDRSMGLREHLETLREAQSESMNLIDSTTSHLHGLMMSVAEDAKKNKDDVRSWARDNTLVVKQTVEVARELHKSMRIKLDTVRALHKISNDIAKDGKD